MKKCITMLAALMMSTCYMHAHNDDLLVLLPSQLGDIALIDNFSIETAHVQCTSCPDGVVHTASYKDGLVTMVISATSYDSKRELGIQRIFRKGQEISSTKDFYLDIDQPNTLVHVHKKYVVFTNKDKQVIVPR